MPDVTTSHVRFSDIIVFFGNFFILLHVFETLYLHETFTYCVLSYLIQLEHAICICML